MRLKKAYSLIKCFIKENWKDILPFILSANKKQLNKIDAKKAIKSASNAAIEGATAGIQFKLMILIAIISFAIGAASSAFMCWLYYR